MLTKMSSSVFQKRGEERQPIVFKEGLNVILGKDDGAMSIGKSSALLAIDFVFGGEAYLKSDGAKRVGVHTINFEFTFDGKPYWFARSTHDADIIKVCVCRYEPTGEIFTKKDFTEWLKKQYNADCVGNFFEDARSGFFRVYGKENTDECKPMKGVPGQTMENSIDVLLALFNKYEEVEASKLAAADFKEKLDTYRKARKYNFVSNLVGGKKTLRANQAKILELEGQLNALTETAEQPAGDDQDERIQLEKQLTTRKYRIEAAIREQERRMQTLDANIERCPTPTEADLAALREYFPTADIRRLAAVEVYHQKLSGFLLDVFVEEKTAAEEELANLQNQHEDILRQIREYRFSGEVSQRFLERYAELKSEISALRAQNEAYLMEEDLKAEKTEKEEVFRESVSSVLTEVAGILNTKMKELNDLLFSVPRKPPCVRFLKPDKYEFETPDDTGTGSNYKGMIVYDLAVLFTTALPAIAHDSLLFKNVAKDVEDGVVRIYNSSKKQIFIAYDKQGDCRPETQRILNDNCVLSLSDNGNQLYGRSWNEIVPG